jgi:hypothetical protein
MDYTIMPTPMLVSMRDRLFTERLQLEEEREASFGCDSLTSAANFRAVDAKLDRLIEVLDGTATEARGA